MLTIHLQYLVTAPVTYFSTESWIRKFGRYTRELHILSHNSRVFEVLTRALVKISSFLRVRLCRLFQIYE